jgi:DNA-binding CsgD family transcriptional regulator
LVQSSATLELNVAAEQILKLVQDRSAPGVLILGTDDRILYCNAEAMNILDASNDVPPEVRRLCEQVRAGAGDADPGGASGGNCALLWRQEGSPCSLRAFLIGESGGRRPTHIMVLVEKVTERHGINLKKARSGFGLSDREIEVVALVAQGLANKEIACRLFISDHTVKDHLKNISRKMRTSSRGEIIALLQ